MRLSMLQDASMTLSYVRFKPSWIWNIRSSVTVDDGTHVHRVFLPGNDLRNKMLKYWGITGHPVYGKKRIRTQIRCRLCSHNNHTEAKNWGNVQKCAAGDISRTPLGGELTGDAWHYLLLTCDTNLAPGSGRSIVRSLGQKLLSNSQRRF
jgi:ribosomal protein L37E